MDDISEAGILNCSAPQGYGLGPLLFLIHINDLPQSSESGSYLHADDTCIFYKDKDVTKIEDVPNKEFSTLWESFQS